MIAINTEYIDWKKRINKEPSRYTLVRNENGILIEVHDTRTNEVWFKVDGDRWMKL